jgi:hypothetical protein
MYQQETVPVLNSQHKMLQSFNLSMAANIKVMGYCDSYQNLCHDSMHQTTDTV